MGKSILLERFTRELLGLENLKRAMASLWFFKTGKGQYGEGDEFLGINVPTQRRIARKYIDLSLGDIQILLNNKIHEFRLVALFILVLKYKKASDNSASSALTRKEIVDFYLRNTKYVNNWDLVDSSAGYILGEYLYHKRHPRPDRGSRKMDSRLRGNDKESEILYKLARSGNIWERRIAIIATQGFIRRDMYDDTLKISEVLLKDKHDLIHKAVGWMLREVGKRDLLAELKFLDKHYQKMPRTMLRYAIEKLDKEKKAFYMKKVDFRV